MEGSQQNHLAHYGIKGMKWGVRRPVGPDGLVGGSGVKTNRRRSRGKGASGSISQDAKVAGEATKKAREKGKSALSNKELKSIQERQNLERNVEGKKSRRKTTSSDAKSARSLDRRAKSKGVGNLSNKEMQEVITRMELQQRYDSLKKNNSKVESGKSFFKDVASDVLKTVATTLAEEAVRGAASSAARTYQNRSRRTDQNAALERRRQRAIGR